MVSFLEYNPIFHPAIMQVFGKTLICRSLDLCSHFARTANLDCITPEGKHTCVHCIGIYTLWIMAVCLCRDIVYSYLKFDNSSVHCVRIRE